MSYLKNPLDRTRVYFEGDTDFYDLVQRVAEEIQNAKFLMLKGVGQLSAHLQNDIVAPAILRTLRAAR